MKYLFANWKMYLNVAESLQLANELSKVPLTKELQLIVFPTTLALTQVQMALGQSPVLVGAQNCAWVPKGAYTGAVSAFMLKEAGCSHVLVGHSERRYISGESDTDVRKKIEACLDAGLIPVVCIGETKEEKEDGKREYRLKKQLFTAFKDLALNGGSVMIAYEPVWAVSGRGTGEICSPADADDIHGWIKEETRQYISTDVPLLYGGSVDATNVVSYLSLDMVQGVLVGGASSRRESLVALIEAAQSIT